MNSFKTVYTVIAASLFAVATASAAPKPVKDLNLKFDDKYKPGQLLVTAVSRNAAAVGIVLDDVLLEMCTVPASAAHAAQIEALARSAGMKSSQGKGKEMCAPVKNRMEQSTVLAPFEMRGSKAGYELENTMKFRHANGKVFTVKLADIN
jgi:hypothetical protein